VENGLIFQADSRQPRLGLGRRGFGLVAAAWLAACTPQAPRLVLSGDDQVAISQISAYLNGLQHFTAQFTQAGPDGFGTGTVWLSRPGQLRVEYVRPSPKLMLANHGRLLLVDETTHATTSLRLSRTPLDILLAQPVVLSGPVTITGLQRVEGGLQLSLVKADAPAQGTLTLRFTADPLALQGVTVLDRNGQTTAFNLTGLDTKAAIDPAIFEYHATPPNG
jgi:outer membrane lipoprotein-sorting protein